METLARVLQREFPGSIPLLEPTPSGKIGGILLWDGFEGQPQHERQRVLWKKLREDISTEQQRGVSAILTLTPLERDVILEDE